MKSDTIDPAVGIMLHAKTRDIVTPQIMLATLHVRAGDEGKVDEWTQILRSAYTFDADVNNVETFSKSSLVLEVVE